MLRIALLGAGSHSEWAHGPSLARYAEEHPGEVTLAAVCDRREERARLFCAKFGFARAYPDLEEMLHAEMLDACWVVAPVESTRELAGRVMEHGLPTFLEKPPGNNLEEAWELAEIAARKGTPNMVAFNRRWAPCTRQALAWAEERGPFEYLYARMLRLNRRDERFAFGTGIHLLDCVRALGETAMWGLKSARTAVTHAAAGAPNFHVDLTLGSGPGRCDILPTCGLLDESYTLFGRNCTVAFALPWTGGAGITSEGRAELWVEGKLAEAHTWPAEPTFVNSGFYGEAMEFISALQEGRSPSPTCQQAVDSVALAEAAQEGREIEFV